MSERLYLKPEEKREQEIILLANITSRFEDPETLLKAVNRNGVYEDLVYRFYHQSVKVFALQESTLAIVNMLESLAPHSPMNTWFLRIVAEGTGKQFQLEDNDRWLEITRPIAEAYFHARYFLEMVCKYGKQFKTPPTVIPSGWDSVLYLYNLR